MDEKRVDDEILIGHVQEIRRGSVVLACLAVLREPRYGYALLGTLRKAGIRVDGNTLYPLLRRLERQGLLTSAWNTEDVRPRKYYRISPAGELLLERLRTDWRTLNADLERLLREETS